MSRRFWWVVGVVLVALALVVCLIPMPPPKHPMEFDDKIAHLLGHCALAVYFTGLVDRRGWWKIFVLLLLFGIGVEVAQHHMNLGREGDVRDVMGNTMGNLLGLLIGYLGVSRWPAWFGALVGRRAAE
jgi:VanZ family protein